MSPSNPNPNSISQALNHCTSHHCTSHHCTSHHCTSHHCLSTSIRVSPINSCSTLNLYDITFLSMPHSNTNFDSHALMVSWSHTLMLLWSHALMHSCTYTLMLLCTHALMLLYPHALMLLCTHALMHSYLSVHHITSHHFFLTELP